MNENKNALKGLPPELASAAKATEAEGTPFRAENLFVTYRSSGCNSDANLNKRTE